MDSILVETKRLMGLEPGTGSILNDVRFFYYPTLTGLLFHAMNLLATKI